MERIEFQKKLSELSKLAKENGNCLSTEEVQNFLSALSLNEEQLHLVYEYLSASQITIKGYVSEQPEKILSSDSTDHLKKESISYTPEEQHFLQRYQKDLKAFSRLEEDDLEALLLRAQQGDAMAKAQATEQFLHQVLQQAKNLRGQGLPLEDLVQEGNIGLMLSLETLSLRDPGTAASFYVHSKIQEALQDALKEAQHARRNSDQIADKVNKLSDSILQLTDDLERQVSIEELSAFLDMDIEEIEDILKLAGEQVEVADSKPKKE